MSEKGNVFGPISAVQGVAFVGTDIGNLYAIDTATGVQLWTYTAPAQIGGGASIVRNRIFWGYGFTLFSGSGPGGILSFKVKAAGRHHYRRSEVSPSGLAKLLGSGDATAG